jgi:hypothetical protein
MQTGDESCTLTAGKYNWHDNLQKKKPTHHWWFGAATCGNSAFSKFTSGPDGTD